MAQDTTPSSQLRVLTPDGRPSDEQPKWRKDFPIDTAQDNYVARRDFTKFMVLISGSFVAAGAPGAEPFADAGRDNRE